MYVGAGEFHIQPRVPNSEVIDKFNRLCGLAKRNCIIIIVSVNGKYHPMKERKNSKQKEHLEESQVQLENHLKSNDIEAASNRNNALKLMKGATYWNDYVIITADGIFLEQGFKVY